MIESGANKYIESSNIRVFPCAYRGYYDKTGSGSLVFDPEARATTESNFANTFHKLSNAKKSYVVSWDKGNGTNTVLKCVIGGYYFEIYNQSMTDLFYFKEDENVYHPYTLCIKTAAEELANSDADGTRTTSILTSFERTNGTTNDRYLDVKKGASYIFTGLSLLPTHSAETSEHLVPFLAVEATDQGTLPETAGTLSPSACPITALLDTGTGKYSIRMLEDDAGSAFNTTIASGDYAIALGRHTEAQATASTALGDNTLAAGEASLAGGANTKALGKYTLALGDSAEAISEASISLGTGTKTNNTNQIVLGKYNYEDASQLFILANGVDADPRSSAANKFTVSYAGDVKALGALETKDNIAATGTGKVNHLILGSTADNSSGAIDVYGVGSSKVFNVTNEGAATMTGIVSITNDTQSTAIGGGALRVNGGVGIKKTVNIGENLNVAGNTDLKGKLTVATSRDTELGGKLIVANETTINGNLKLPGTSTAFIGGGLEVGQNTNLKGDLVVDAGHAVTLGSAVSITNAVAAGGGYAALSVAGGTQIDKNLTVGTNVVIKGTTNATSKDTGALIVKGGAGIDGDVYVSGAIYSPKGVVITSGGAAVTGTAKFEKTEISGDTSIADTTTSTSTDSGALVVTGGVGIGENLNIGGTLNLAKEFTAEKAVTIKGNTSITATTDSTSTTTGALTVAGGLGVVKQLQIGGNITAAKNLTLNGTDSAPATITLGTTSANNKGGQLRIYGTGTSEVFEVTNAGNTTVAGTLSVTGKVTTTTEAVIGGKLTVDNKVEISQTGITGLSSVVVDGKVEGHYFNATSYNTTSDSRKKCNIEPYHFANSILKVPVKQFEYINDPAHTKYIGFIAQDLQQVCPNLVTENSDGMLSIQESKLFYALLQEVKELKEKVEMLERR